MGAFCTNCGNEIREGAAFCTSCGAPVTPVEQTPAGDPIPVEPLVVDASIPAGGFVGGTVSKAEDFAAGGGAFVPPATPAAAAPPAQGGGKKKGLIIGIVAAVVVVLAIIAVAFVVALPRINFSKGADALMDGNYAEAAEAFSKAGDYNDASYYAKIASDLDADDTGRAETILHKDGYELAKYAYGDYFFNIASDEADADALDQAATFFKAAGDFEDARERADECENGVAMMEANWNFEHGYLADAQEEYEALDPESEWDGVTAQERLDVLEAHQQFVDITGYYSSSDAHYEGIVNTTKWTTNGTRDVDAIVTAVINDDDTVTVTYNITAYDFYTVLWSNEQPDTSDVTFAASVNAGSVPVSFGGAEVEVGSWDTYQSGTTDVTINGDGTMKVSFNGKNKYGDEMWLLEVTLSKS